jgi:protein-S-isoprenylcysteine O-methyltransferase Ste14
VCKLCVLRVLIGEGNGEQNKIKNSVFSVVKIMGKFLFKYRSFLPVPYFLFLLIVVEFDWLNFLIGSFIVLSGLLIRFFSQGFAGDWMRGSEVEASYMLDEGAYSIMRNPLYLGNFFVGFGFTLASSFYPVFLLPFYSIVFFIYYYLIVKEEENYLEEKFGERFIRYRESTPAFYPNFRKWQKGQFLSRNALRMELSTYLTVVFIFVLFLVRVFLKK